MRLAGAAFLVAILLALPAGAAASEIDLAHAAGGIRIDGQAQGDAAGAAVADAGDLNGDGNPDLVVAAPHASNNSRAQSGSVYVVYGGRGLAGVDLLNLGPAGFRIDGAAAGDAAGKAVAAAGDVNGDGVDDLIVGAPFADQNGHSASGSVYVIYGQRTADLAELDLASITTTPSSRGLRIDGAAASDNLGTSIASGGDVNGDGSPDLIVAAPFASNNARDVSGSVYVLYGGHGFVGVNLGSLGAAGFRIDGAAADDHVGLSVAGMGDFNGDGIADVVAGAPHASDSSRPNSGSAYVVYGQANVDPADVDLANIAGTQSSRGMRIGGAATGDVTGLAVASVDLNGDGLSDAVVGALEASARLGDSFVVYGQPSPDPGDVDLAAITTSQASRGMRIAGADFGQRSGEAVAGAGDLNGDGMPDLIVGAPDAADNERDMSGSSYVIYGQATADPADLDLAQITTTQSSLGLRIDGAQEFSNSGAALAGSADLNGDGHPDAIIGAPLTTTSGRTGAGAAYVLDLAGPDAAIDSAPTLTNDPTPTFAFHASEPASFQCSIDRGAASFGTCLGPDGSHTPPAPLTDGTYTFRAAARDLSGNPDPTPAIRQFTVDTTAPDTMITRHPNKRLTRRRHAKRTKVSFRFKSTEPGSTFSCRLDKKKPRSCASPLIYRLKQGRHTFAVAATDPAGNTDLSAASFKLDVKPPRQHRHQRHR
jgi:hypothetical protein